MAFTQDDLTAIDRAIASSELEVELEGRRVKFDNFEGLRNRRAYIADQIAQAARPSGAFRYRFTTSRGD